MNDVPDRRRSPRTILVGVDGTPGSRRALQWAAAWARESGARIVAVHVLTYSRELAGDIPPEGMTNWRRQLQKDLAGSWTDVARAAGADVRTAMVEDDSPPGGLLAAARAEHAEMIVLGAHGHGGVADRILGSTTYRVAHRASAPVVVVPQDWRPGGGR